MPRLLGDLDAGRLTIDNNAYERASRLSVIGRRNCLFD